MPMPSSMSSVSITLVSVLAHLCIGVYPLHTFIFNSIHKANIYAICQRQTLKGSIFELVTTRFLYQHSINWHTCFDMMFAVLFCRYFHALANGEVPPVKDRLEQPLPSMDERLGGLTKGGLAVLHKQVSVCHVTWLGRL